MKSSEGQIAFVSYVGWDEIAYRVRESVSPVTKQSQMLYGSSKREKYYEYKPYAMISAVLTKKDNSVWKEEELFPIQSITYQDPEGCGGYGPIKITLKDGKQVVVDYEGMEGRLMV